MVMGVVVCWGLGVGFGVLFFGVLFGHFCGMFGGYVLSVAGCVLCLIMYWQCLC